MTVVVVAACPIGLRGHLTRWLLEIAPGIFVGKISARVRDRVWDRVTDIVKTGRAIMVYSADNEQGLAFKVHAHEWIPVDHEGINLILRPATRDRGTVAKGWSTASKRRRYGRPK